MKIDTHACIVYMRGYSSHRNNINAAVVAYADIVDDASVYLELVEAKKEREQNEQGEVDGKISVERKEDKQRKRRRKKKKFFLFSYV